RARLEAPAPELRQVLQQRRERGERVLADEARRRAGGLETLLVVGLVDHVLADPLLPYSLEPDHRRPPQELLGDRELEPVQRHALDDERQVGKQGVRGHWGLREYRA